MSLPNSKELKHKLLRWLTNYPRTTRKVLQSKRRKSLRQANHNQSKICQELQKRASNLRRGRSSRRSSSLREPSGTPKGSGRSLTQREMLSSFKRLSIPTVMTISKTVIQRVIETSEHRPKPISSSETINALLVACENLFEFIKLILFENKL